MTIGILRAVLNGLKKVFRRHLWTPNAVIALARRFKLELIVLMPGAIIGKSFKVGSLRASRAAKGV